jgi:MFS family permease
MKSHLLSVTALLGSFAILCLGHGLQSILLPARGAMFEDYPNLTTGAMMSAYYVGFIAGTFICPALISRVGHIRVFAAASSCASVIMLLHALINNPLAWIALRVFYGFCLVNLYTVMESWLNSIGEPKNRGKILSVYMIINFLAMSAGQLLFFLAPIEGFELFSISAIMLSLALVPLILSRSVQPNYLPAPEFFGIKQLFKVSPLGVTGALIAGLMGGAYWGLTAIFILHLGYAQQAVAWFMSASLIGGLCAQWPLGALSDRINRRYIIMLAASMVSITACVLAMMAFWKPPAETYSVQWLILIGAFFGAGFHPLYSLCIAHANDYIAPEHFVRASTGLQLVQGIGAIAGPMAAGAFMYIGGYPMLYAYIASLSGLLVLYNMQRITSNRPVPEEFRSPFRLLTRTGIFASRMDPRSRD